MRVSFDHTDLRGNKMKKLPSALAILSSLCIIFVMIGLCHAWVIGENRITNSDFENDEVAKKPKMWDLEKGG